MIGPKALLAALVMLALASPICAQMQTETVGGDTLMAAGLSRKTCTPWVSTWRLTPQQQAM
jgi:hypothetical protein